MNSHKLKIGDKEYNFLFSMLFWKTFYNETGISLNEVGERLVTENLIDQLECAAGIIYSGALTYDKKFKTDQGLTPDDAFEALGEISQQDLTDLFSKLWDTKILGNPINAGMERNAEGESEGK